MTITESTLTIDGTRIHYFHGGESGPVVLLLHGGGIDSARLSWELLMPELAQTHRVYAPDFPGYGESERPAHLPYTNEFMVDFAGKFLDALGIEKTSLVGISMGGSVSIGYTLENPQRVEKLVLVDSYGLQRAAPMQKLSYLFVNTPGIGPLTWWSMRSRPLLKASLGQLLRRPGALTEELVDMAYQEVLRPGTGRAFGAWQRSEVTWTGTRTVYLDRLGEIDKPVLIVHGSKDSLVPQNDAREAHKRIRGSRLEWIEGAGHWPQRDDPETFNRVVLEFLTAE